MPKDGTIIPQAITTDRTRSLWLPPERAAERELRNAYAPCCDDPEIVKQHKIVMYKFPVEGGSYESGPWDGQMLHMPLEIDIDAPMDDGQTVRDAIHLQITGMRERHEHRFIFQGGDEMQGTAWIEQWSENEHCEDRVRAFINRKPPRRDSPQVVS